MDDELHPQNERELILMIQFSQNTHANDVRLAELLDFVYNDLYADAYGGTGIVAIPDFRGYLASIRHRVEQAAAAGWSLGKLSFGRSIRHLLNLAQREDLVRELDL
jgi:hypothetical protein